MKLKELKKLIEGCLMCTVLFARKGALSTKLSARKVQSTTETAALSRVGGRD